MGRIDDAIAARREERLHVAAARAQNHPLTPAIVSVQPQSLQYEYQRQICRKAAYEL
jgi:hypothetical protein